MKTILSQFHDQLHRERENDHYTEIDINQWKEQLVMIRKQLETPSDIELIPDMQLAPIYLIKVTAIKPETLLQIPVISQITVSCNERNDIDCSCNDNDVDIAKSNITNTDDKSNIEDTHEVSQILEEKEEEEITTTMESCPSIPLVEPRILLDPSKKNHLVVLELSHTLQSQLGKNLLKLTDHPVKTFNQEDDYLNDLKCMEQTILFIDLTSLLSDERNRLLDNLSELDNIYFLYIQGKSVHDDDECGYIFRRYPKIKAMFENEQRLLVQWTIDTVNEYKEAGDMYTELGDKDRGRQCFEEGIKLYNHLSEFLHEKRRIR
ncbi:hypothetical protein I4U23_018775 [Adineta vaga]|nr:hypothetical protein I4U23_018775 [Adineta vaga]